MTRPDLAPDAAELYDWLAANGVDEPVPEGATFAIDGAHLTYTSFAWDGPRGWDYAHMRVTDGGAVIEQRTVPLIVPLTARVRELIALGGGAVELARQ